MAAVVALAAPLSGCTSPGVALPSAPPVAFACSPTTATITTSSVDRHGDVVVLAERAGFAAGSQTTPTISFTSGVTTSVDPGARFDPFASDSDGWIGAIVSAASVDHPVPAGFGDEKSLASLSRPTEYPKLTIGSGVYVIATVAAANSLRFSIRCGGRQVAAGAIVSPSIGGPARVVLVDCGDAATDATARLVRPACGDDGASAKDPDG